MSLLISRLLQVTTALKKGQGLVNLNSKHGFTKIENRFEEDFLIIR